MKNFAFSKEFKIFLFDGPKTRHGRKLTRKSAKLKRQNKVLNTTADVSLVPLPFRFHQKVSALPEFVPCRDEFLWKHICMVKSVQVDLLNAREYI